MQARFNLGRIVITPGALQALSSAEVWAALGRHAAGDWGALGAHDLAVNEEALSRGLRLLSSYRSIRGAAFWIITEADRSATTVLLPEEY